MRSTDPDGSPVNSRAGQTCTQVALGVVRNSRGKVLVTKRCQSAHLGGYLEIPGGKLMRNESPETALAREMREELGIEVHQCRPLIQIP